MLQGYNLHKSSLRSIDFHNNKIINTLNTHSYCLAKQDENFRLALINSEILLPDGIGIVWAENFLNKNNLKKIAGHDLFLFLMGQLEKDKGSAFFLGSSNETLNKIEAKCKIDFPNVKVETFSPPYKAVFSDEDSKLMCDSVNLSSPDVLFVGMTAPKQEKWVYKYKNQLEVRNICAIGAVFDFYAGNIKRSSSFWINLGLEWLPRLVKEPRRLFYRNFVSTPKFILEILSLKIFGKGVL